MHGWFENYVQKSLNKIKPHSSKQKKVDVNGAPVFEPDYDATVRLFVNFCFRTVYYRDYLRVPYNNQK